MSQTTIRSEPSVQRARALRHRRELDRLDYLRTLRELAGSMRQEEIARQVGVSQAAVSKALASARSVPAVPESFSGASPYEIAERFAVGELTREQVVDELSRWPYDSSATSDGYDALIVDQPGTHTWAEVERAVDDGLIDDDIYDEVGRATASATQ